MRLANLLTNLNGRMSEELPEPVSSAEVKSLMSPSKSRLAWWVSVWRSVGSEGTLTGCDHGALIQLLLNHWGDDSGR